MTPATEPLLGPKRQRELLNYIRAYGTGHVNELARVLGVSASTVRRDLNELQDKGLLERVHGGAAPLSDDVEPIRPLREVSYPGEKQRIGERAATLVDDHSTILILGGTTTEAMLPYLSMKHGLTVLTNSLMVVNRLSQYPDIDLVVLGGVLRRSEMSLLGHLTIAGLTEFGVDKVFSGAFGVDPEIGVTGTNLNETQTDRSLASSATELILLADHSKFAQRGPARLVPISSVTTLITDTDTDEETLERFRALSIDVITC